MCESVGDAVIYIYISYVYSESQLNSASSTLIINANLVFVVYLFIKLIAKHKT